MSSPQASVFHEGTSFHWFLHFRLTDRDPGSAGSAGGEGAAAANGAAGTVLAAVAAAVRSVRESASSGPPSETVNVVFGFGPDLLARLDPAGVPAGFRPFTEIVGPAGHVAVATQEDVFVWLHSDRHDRNFEVASAARRAFAGCASLARETPSFVYRDSRDLTGFIDGTENPDADAARSLAVIGDGRPGAGGSFVLTQRWVHDLDAFADLAVTEQEQIVGRTKPDSVQLEVLAPDSHVRRSSVDDDDGEEIKIYRRSVPYGTAAEAGLYFLSFTDDLTKIDRMLASMYGTTPDGVHDRIIDFSRTVSGAYYFAPSAEDLARMITPG